MAASKYTYVQYYDIQKYSNITEGEYSIQDLPLVDSLLRAVVQGHVCRSERLRVYVHRSVLPRSVMQGHVHRSPCAQGKRSQAVHVPRSVALYVGKRDAE